MFHSKKRRFKKHRKKAPLLGRLLRRKMGVEQLCDECSRPYLAKPAAVPLEQFVSGSVVASVFVEQRFGRMNFYVQIGRFATDGRQMFISQMLSTEHLAGTARVASLAEKFIRGQKPVRLVSHK